MQEEYQDQGCYEEYQDKTVTVLVLHLLITEKFADLVLVLHILEDQDQDTTLIAKPIVQEENQN